MASSTSSLKDRSKTARFLLNPKASTRPNGILPSPLHSSLNHSSKRPRSFSDPGSLTFFFTTSPLESYHVAYLNSTPQGQNSTSATVNGTGHPSKLALNPRALLDPKDFAKQARAERREQVQQRSEPQLPYTFETAPGQCNGSNGVANGNVQMGGMGSFIERMHGVANREDRPQKRQKRETEIPDGKEEQVKAAFTGGAGKGGVIGEYMRNTKAEGTEEATKAGSIVDLTTGDDDEVVVVSDPSQREVCFGRIEGARVQAHTLPTPSPTATSLDPDFWPVIKVDLKRIRGNHLIIGVIDPTGADFGSVNTATALGLAALMDAREPGIRVQARIPSRRKLANEEPGKPMSAYYDLMVNIYGQRRHAVSVGRFLSQKQIWLRTPMHVDAGIETLNPHAARVSSMPRSGLSSGPGSSGGAGYATRTVEEIRSDVLGMFDSLQKSENMPEMEADGRIITPLLTHQKQALYFMTNKETERVYSDKDDDGNSLWRLRLRNNGQRMYYNVITGKEERAKPPEVLGGILADMMGLGKTLSILSLVISTLPAAVEWAGKKAPPPKTAEELPLLRNSKTTLLVSPLSTVANWEEQIKSHVQPGVLSYYVYHGNNRCNDIEKLATYDMVITTYSVASSDFDRRGKKMRKGGAASPLEQINWFRIVLDEAHMIREQATRQSKAICTLSARRRWAVTGTPVQNRLEDLGALIKFLRIKPFDEKGGFVQFILSPFKNADPDILPKLRLLVDSITLRRLKDRIDLPPRHDRIVRLRFDEEERALYEHFAKDSDNKMRIVAGERQKSLGGKAYVHILQAILRLRLICAHGKELLSEDDLKMLEGADKSNAIDLDDETQSSGLSSQQAYDTFHLMRETGADVCNQCFRRIGQKDTQVDDMPPARDDILGYMTPCYQLLCKDCIGGFQEAMQKNSSDAVHANCPLCQSYIIISYFELTQAKADEDDEARTHAKENPKPVKKTGRYGRPHTKTRALIDCLLQSQMDSESKGDERPIKSVVFSGWTSHLDLIEIALGDKKIAYTRLDGKMSRTQRGAALDSFRDDPNVSVILVSIAAGGLGLNLTSASKVYVMEPQFNPAAEAQAIDRVHRLGQKREVTATRFIMDGSFEEKMLELQRKKQNLADLSMNRGKLDKHEATKRRLEELRSLFK